MTQLLIDYLLVASVMYLWLAINIVTGDKAPLSHKDTLFAAALWPVVLVVLVYGYVKYMRERWNKVT